MPADNMTTEKEIVTVRPTGDRLLDKHYQQFILFGDSITERSCMGGSSFGFNPALQEAYMRRLDVINRGFSGYTTQNALWILPRFMPSPVQADIRLMLIFFGANDACLPGFVQHVPLDLYRQSLKDICSHPSIEAHSPQLLLVTPPPVNEYQMYIPLPVNRATTPMRTAENTKKYADACREVGEEIGVPVVDLWQAFMHAAGWKKGQALVGSKEVERSLILESLLSDGLHFRSEGYRLMYKTVMEFIEEKLPQNSPGQIPYLYPVWEQAPTPR